MAQQPTGGKHVVELKSCLGCKAICVYGVRNMAEVYNRTRNLGYGLRRICYNLWLIQYYDELLSKALYNVL